MRVTVLFFARARELTGTSEAQLEFDDTASTDSIAQRLLQYYPALQEIMGRCHGRQRPLLRITRYLAFEMAAMALHVGLRAFAEILTRHHGRSAGACCPEIRNTLILGRHSSCRTATRLLSYRPSAAADAFAAEHRMHRKRVHCATCLSTCRTISAAKTRLILNADMDGVIKNMNGPCPVLRSPLQLSQMM